MKSFERKNRFNYSLLTLLLLLAALITSCSQQVQFTPSTVVPAADGKVKVKKDRNGNYALDIKVENLADPSRLEVPKAHYVVWVETESNGSQNLGQLSINKNLFSNALSGSLETVTPYKPIRFFITAEDQGNIQYPGTTMILRSRNYN